MDLVGREDFVLISAWFGGSALEESIEAAKATKAIKSDSYLGRFRLVLDFGNIDRKQK